MPAVQVPDEGEVRNMMTGKATKLESQFRLTYSMILNLLRVEDLKVSVYLTGFFSMLPLCCAVLRCAVLKLLRADVIITIFSTL